MPTFASPPQVYCTPYVGRVIKGWSVRVRLCFTISATEAGIGTLTADVTDAATQMLPLIQALSEASFVGVGSSFAVTDVPFGAQVGNYAGAEDSAVFSFLTATGSVAKVSIPAPLGTIFLSDDQTINPANGAVVAFVNALTSGQPTTEVPAGSFYGSTKSGAYYVKFLGGIRRRGKTRRKMNIFVREPSGTTTTPSIPAI